MSEASLPRAKSVSPKRALRRQQRDEPDPCQHDHMIYIALLRGINVGGKGIIKMSTLKDCFEQAGMTNVATYIQSGNVTFETGKRPVSSVTTRVERAIAQAFGQPLSVVVQSAAQFERVVADVPFSWPRDTHLRRYIAFLRAPVTAAKALKAVDARESVDIVTPGRRVLYMSTRLDALAGSRLTKLVGTPIYQNMTIRNYSTSVKVLALIRQR
jgi:uncharacterized protein (DUF1697 family)